MVDTDGRSVMLQAHPTSVQDRDGAIPLLQASRGLLSFIESVFADSAYAAERVANATSIIIEIVRKQVGQIGFAVHPRRWVVERLFAWLGRKRRLAKDFEGAVPSEGGKVASLPQHPMALEAIRQLVQRQSPALHRQRTLTTLGAALPHRQSTATRIAHLPTRVPTSRRKPPWPDWDVKLSIGLFSISLAHPPQFPVCFAA
jgi:transposase